MPPLILSTAYLGPVSYYCRLACHKEILIEQWEHYVKQTWRNRCHIATAAGVQALTVPVERHLPPHAPIRDVRLSDHGQWPHLHWQALVTAYESSPFFEYYANDLRPHYEHPPRFLLDFNESLRATLCRLIGLEPHMGLTTAYETLPAEQDLRLLISPKHPEGDPAFHPTSYWQVFVQRHGFLPNLSIVDLLFNMGPEAILCLQNSSSIPLQE